MKYERLYNFISPVTGKLPIDRGYILLGDKEGRSFTSPVLIDVRQDIIDLRRKISNFEELNKLDYNRIWIGNYYNEPEERLHIGIINLPPLAEAVFPNPISPIIGDFRIPNPTFDYLSAFDWVMSGPFLPQIYATKYDTFGNPIGTDISSSLAMTQVRAAQIMKRFDNADFIVGSSNVEFAWENPKMALIPETLKQLYELGTTYTFTKAQSLGNLQTGLLKNTVNNATGTLSTAISGEDYVNTADFPVGSLVILDPLYPLPGHKLIAPISFSIRGNTANEFGYPVANTIDVLTGDASKFEKLAVTSIENNALIKSNNGELVKAVAGTDYVIPSVIIDILASLTATELIVKNIIGVNASVNIKDVTDTQAKALTTAVKNAVGLTESVEIGELSAEAADLVTNKSALLEIEAQIAALAGVQTITTLGTILGFLGLAASGKTYGDYIRGQSLNIKNTYKSADLNDEGHNAVGDFEFRYPSGYSSDDRGYSTLWFDSKGRNSSHASSAGLRLFAWDSGGDHLGYDAPLAPLHIGIFGYQNKYNLPPFPNPTPVYKGFVFECNFHNEDSGYDYYRFPKKFGLYDVKKTISTFFTQRWGWDYKNPIFEYDYSNFTFNTPVKFLDKTAIKIPVGNTSERPAIAEVGMIRYNMDLEVYEQYNGSSWLPLASGTVSSVNITGSTGISISGSPITSSGTITLTLSSGLQNLSSYSSASFLQVANNLSDILNSSTARANLGLTNVATQAVTNNSILIGGASNSIASQALTNGQILIGSTGAAPVATVPTNGTNISWTTEAGSLTANISGQIALSNGGTGISLTTAYGILCGGTTSTGNLQNAGTGSSGYFLGGNGASALPSWKTAVTSVAVTGSTGLTVSGSPITSTGTISLTLANELQYFSQLYPYSALYGGLIYRKANYPFAPSYTMMNFAVSGSGFNLSMSDSYYTFSLGTELQGLSGLSSIGIIVRTGSGTYTTRTITAGNSSITVNNGDGLTANPSITIGTVPIANLANYPSSSTQFLRGNGSWSQPTFNDIGSPTNGSTLDFNNSTITNLGSLSVNSTASAIPSATWFAYFKIQQTGIAAYSAISGVWNAGGLPRSIICTGAVSATEFESISSIKKKNIISNYEDFKEELKEKFDTIDFVKYEWKDKLKEGFGEYYGYIAENVSKAFPELVNLKHTEYAPNILEYADLSHISGKNYRITFNKNIEIEIGKKLKIISKNEKTFEAILTMKENNNSYLLSFLTDAPSVGEFLVYGSYEEVPLVSKTRFHDMSAARLKILIDEVSNLSQRIDKIENSNLNLL